MAVPMREPLRCALCFTVVSYSRNGYSKDFLRYNHDSGRLLVFLAIRCCVNTTETKAETARLGHELGTSVRYKAEGKSRSTVVTP